MCSTTVPTALKENVPRFKKRKHLFLLAGQVEDTGLLEGDPTQCEPTPQAEGFETPGVRVWQ